ncbi:MAG: hypothetical protein GEU96_18325 [Propionibacteriales bacterium]|nr:hypothetical protein [Propionibacteriales bacterium]
MSQLSVIPAAVALLVLAGCGGSDGESTTTSGEGDATLSISSPDKGAELTLPFTVELDSSVPLDDPDTGEKHVHLFFDGDDAEYILVYGDSIEVEELPEGVSEGEHVMNASLRNADHSAVGVETEIEVTIGSGSGGGDDGGDSGGGDDGPDYNY